MRSTAFEKQSRESGSMVTESLGDRPTEGRSDSSASSGCARPLYLEVQDSRRFPAPWQEPLALKLLRDRMKADNVPDAFRRNALLFYFALTQVSAMRGSNRFRIYKKQMEDLSFVRHEKFVDIKAYLERAKLCSFSERIEEGARKRVFCTLLEAPWTGAPNASREECRGDAHSGEREWRPRPGTGPIEADEDGSSVSTPFVVDTSEQRFATTDDPTQASPNVVARDFVEWEVPS